MSSKQGKVTAMFALLALVGGCYQENLPELDIQGRLVLPREAVTRDVPVFDDSGAVVGSESLTDLRLVGPVYLGAFSSMDDISFTYPHPSMGPIITPDEPGDTFPYGGSTVGRFDFACYSALACKVTTGRFTGYQEILDYFKDVLGRPVLDQHGAEVTSASAFQQRCFDYFYTTSDEEHSFIGPQDFEEQDDGSFAADFVMQHTTLVPGMTLWGFMDAPKIAEYVEGEPYSTGENGNFTTCNESLGRQYQKYDEEFFEGAPPPDLLNFPGNYITAGDWVADGTTIMNTADETPTITLNIKVEE